MATVYRCWERATGEELADTGATALFGDRRAGRTEEEEKPHRHLEQPWRVLHAATALALDQARRRTRPIDFQVTQSPMPAKQKRVWTAAKILGLARREMDYMLQSLESDARRLGTYPALHKLWFRTGRAPFAVYRGGSTVSLCV